MNGRPQEFAELSRLLAALVDEQLTDEQFQRLDGLLYADPRARAYLIRYVDLHAEVMERADWGELPTAAAASSPDQADLLTGPLHVAPANAVKLLRSAPRRRSRWRGVGAGAALAATILLMTAVFWSPVAQRLRLWSVDRQVAVISQAHDATWQTSEAVHIGDAVGGRALQLRSGLVQLRYANGAIVTVEGPAEFVVSGPAAIRMTQGRLAARVVHGKAGFEVVTPRSRIVDLGTVFGVSCSPAGDASVSVFEGAVRVETAVDSQNLVAGDAARTDSGSVVREPFDQEPYAGVWQINEGLLRMEGAATLAIRSADNPAEHFEDNSRVFVYPEGGIPDAAEPVIVDLSEVGVYTQFPATGSALPALPKGARSYLIHFNPVGRSGGAATPVRGSLCFDGPILGVITHRDRLNDSDHWFDVTGAEPDRVYEGNARGMEGNARRKNRDDIQVDDLDDAVAFNGDAVQWHRDGKTISFTMRAGASVDQARILVGAAEATTPIGGSK